MPVTINGSNTPTAGGVTYGDGTQYATTAAGSAGQLLQSNGASAPSWVAAPTTSPAGSTGQVQYNNAGAFGAVSSGTSGQVLTSAGTGAAPTWTTPSAGALVYISTTTASGSANTLDITTGFSSTYNDYVLIGENITLGGVANTFYCLRFYTASTLRTSSYQYAQIRALGAPGSSRSSSDVRIDINPDFYSTSTGSFNLLLQNTNSTSTKIQGQVTTTATDDSTVSGDNVAITAFGYTGTNGPLTGISLFWQNASGTFATGTFKLYGIAKA